MCGIFGLVAAKEQLPQQAFFDLVDNLFLFSESRGKESSGAVLVNSSELAVCKGPFAASRLIRDKRFKKFLSAATADREFPSWALLGHARLVTNGSGQINENNQPVVKNGTVGIHNGIIVNDRELWQNFPQLKRDYQVDTEVFLSLFDLFVSQGDGPQSALKKVFDLIKGNASVALLFNNKANLLLATNNGSLYYLRDSGLLIFASEKYILSRLVKDTNYFSAGASENIKKIQPRSGLMVDLVDLREESFDGAGGAKIFFRAVKDKPIRVINLAENKPLPVFDLAGQLREKQRFETLIVNDVEPAVAKLRRCRKCILPETMPFIEFDSAGVCNYCRDYQPIKIKDPKFLETTLAKYRGQGDNCLVPFSGGRDSSYGLHYLKNELKMKPVAYSYDWGMITDLARRNQARLCGQLGIEHILVSADIRKKRNNIRKNVSAWLRKPDLGTVPLFMAGDKQFFFYANQIKKNLDLPLIFMCQNSLEKTDFKSGFCGVPPSVGNVGKNIYGLDWSRQLKQSAYYAQRFLLNPAFINGSLADTAAAYFSYYLIPHHYIYFYNYFNWNEELINKTLINTYDWEIAPDSPSTWRIGDGTAPFYNYIFYVVAGFTENDTFRSNQIREGMITRTEALAKNRLENFPRFDAIRWYLDTIGLDFVSTIDKINSLPKLYRI